jgi:hypothetical protein
MRAPRSWAPSHPVILMIVCIMIIAVPSGVSAAAIEGSQSRSVSPEPNVWATIGTATATTRPVETLPMHTPQVAVGPRLKPPPTATPMPSGPGSYVNYLAVGAVVRENVPPRTIVMGNPAKVVVRLPSGGSNRPVSRSTVGAATD